MSEIKTLDGLRDWVSHIDENPHLGELTDTGKFGLRNIADAIQAEVDERFMELPVDADGVPIHVGDLVALNYGEPFKVGGIRDAGNQWHIFRYELNRWWSPLDLHHVKPRTLEDVLNDCADEISEKRGIAPELNRDTPTRNEIVDKYAAEIRELLSGDAE